MVGVLVVRQGLKVLHTKQKQRQPNSSTRKPPPPMSTLPINATALDAPKVPERARASVSGTGFSHALRAAQQTGDGIKRVQIEPGDTLRGLVRAHTPGPLNEQQLSQRVALVAQANGLSDPNKIIAGEFLRMPSAETPSAPLTQRSSSHHRVLSQTLDRAVAKGYIAPRDKPLVEQRIVAMGKRHGFSPDDFARVALMESDGLNPKATNGRCHGIIQFCEGVARGADSVGLRGRAHEIAQMSVPQQLKLVDRYLEDVRVGRPPSTSTDPRPPHRVALDDLYLAVLTPSARREKRTDAPLSIAGEQARALYVDSDRDKAITRESLIQGLQRHASRVLNQHQAQSGKPVVNERQQLAARNSYVDVAMLDNTAAKSGQRKP